MELRHLKYFLAVAEHANFSRASEALHVAQPALSRQLHDLEAELGVSLFDRGPRGAKLTPAGAAFVPEAKAVLGRVETARQVARAFAAGEQGELHLGYAPSPTVELLPRVLHSFQSEAPGVHVKLHDLSTEEMLAELEASRLHAGLLVKPMKRNSTEIKFEQLAEYPVCVAAGRTHKFARARRVTLGLVAAEPLLAFTRSDYPEYHEWIEAVLAPLGITPRIAEEHDGAHSLIAAIEAGRGVALVLSSFACIAGPRLRVREVTPPPTPFVVGVAWNASNVCPMTSRFLKVARQIGRSAPFPSPKA